MFCPNCGSEIKDTDLFCGECGARIEPVKQEAPKSKPTQPKTEPKTEPKKESKIEPKKAAPKKKGTGFKEFSDQAKKIIIAEVAVLVVLIAAFIYLGNRNSSPASAANQYVKDYNNKKWSKIYEYYNLDHDTFINAEAFEKTMDQNETKTLSAPTGGYVSYGSYAGQYVYQAKRGSDEVEIHVAKSAKKNFFFFDKYEVINVTDTGLQTDSVKLFTLPGVTVKIDGIAAKVPADTSDSTYYAAMFAGTHKITLSGAEDLFDQTSYTFKTSDENPMGVVQYSGDAKTEAAKALKSYLPAITEAKIKDQGTSGLTSYFTSSTAAESYGDSLCSLYYYGSEAKALAAVKLTKCQAADTSDDDTVAEGIPVAVRGSRNYKYPTWGGGYDTETCDIEGVAKMIKKDGKWLINSISYYY